jgi:hypothetical protein
LNLLPNPVFPKFVFPSRVFCLPCPPWKHIPPTTSLFPYIQWAAKVLHAAKVLLAAIRRRIWGTSHWVRDLIFF